MFANYYEKEQDFAFKLIKTDEASSTGESIIVEEDEYPDVANTDFSGDAIFKEFSFASPDVITEYGDEAPSLEDIEEMNSHIKTVVSKEFGIETIKVQTPALICVLKSEFEPSRPLINGVIEAQDAEIKTLSLQDLGLQPDEVGIKGSPTYVSKAFRPEIKHACQKFDCLENGKGAEIILNKMKEIGVHNG